MSTRIANQQYKIVSNSFQPDKMQDGILLNESDCQAINRRVTEGMHLILEALYISPYARQKDLSVAVHTSPSSLSNQLNKMNSHFPPLIGSELRGRDKLFFLTAEGQEYVRWKHANPKKQNLQNTSMDLVQNTVSLNGITLPDELLNIAVNNSLRHYIHLSALSDFEKSNPDELFKVIDDIFARCFPSVFPVLQPENSIYTASLNDTQYFALYFSLSQITLHCLKKKFSKTDILDYLKNIVGLKNMPVTANYLSEKIERISHKPGIDISL